MAEFRSMPDAFKQTGNGVSRGKPRSKGQTAAQDGIEPVVSVKTRPNSGR